MAYCDATGDLNSAHTESSDEQNIVDDLSIVPLEKDGFAICEFCGRVGRRTGFCLKDKKFCSLPCMRSSVRRKHRYNWRFKLMENGDHMAGMIPLEPLPQLQQWHATLNDLQAGPIKQSAALVANSYEWKDELFGCDFLAAPVSLFKHAPLHEMWDSTFEGMKVEVKNSDCENSSEKLSDYFWVATVLKVKGYMGLLRYEGFGSDDSKDFWVNLCCSEVHPVGWCATRGKPLIPPRSIEDKYTDWKKFLVKQLTGARTLPANFYTKLNDSLVSRFTVGSIMEVVDKNRISQVKVASVCEIIGKRLHIKYYDSSPEDNGFWCHEDSPLIHPVGWAFRIGHPLDAPQSYCQRVAAGRLLSNDTTPDMFFKYPTNEPPLFAEGMKLEAIDPLNLSAICAATVMQILNEGYMMIRIDCYPADATGADWFCYHQRSPCIFPVGFALANNIALVPPNGFTPEEFGWETYLAATGCHAAQRSVFAARGHVVSHGFVAGMRLECADLMDPRLVCVATVARVVSDLLKVHFDGWGAEYDQWLWAHSTDVYPVGWCRAVGHRLEGPLQPAPRVRLPRKLPARPARPTKPSRRTRKKQPVPKTAPLPLNTTEENSQNSDMCESNLSKSLSPPTSVSEVSADAHPETEDNKMDVDETKDEADVIKLTFEEDSSKDEAACGKSIFEEESSKDETACSKLVFEEDSSKDEGASGKMIFEEDSSKDEEACGKLVFEDENSKDETACDNEEESNKDEMACGKLIYEDDNSKDEDACGKMILEEESNKDETACDKLIFEEDNSKDEGACDKSIFEEDRSKDESNTVLLTELPEDPPENNITNEEETQAECQQSEDMTETHKDDKVIPRLINKSVPLEVLNSVEPENWTTNDVAKFLTVNDCQPYCVNFANITGPMMLQLSKDEIIELLEMKVGPSLKIFDLIQQLKCKLKQPQCRLLGSFSK